MRDLCRKCPDFQNESTTLGPNTAFGHTMTLNSSRAKSSVHCDYEDYCAEGAATYGLGMRINNIRVVALGTDHQPPVRVCALTRSCVRAYAVFMGTPGCLSWKL